MPNRDGIALPDHNVRNARFKRLWDLAERMDWNDRRPRWFWRWLLRKCDEANGHGGLDYDY
jgi:hypothetical protein